jgi:hypothetical protein
MRGRRKKLMDRGRRGGGRKDGNDGRRFPHKGSGFIFVGGLGHGRALYGDLYMQWIKIEFYSSISIASNCKKPSAAVQNYIALVLRVDSTGTQMRMHSDR